MRQRWDLSEAEWTLRGWRQNDWRWETSFARIESKTPEINDVPARVPGSVRGALVDHGVVPSPYSGLRSRDSEWIENRHWTYTATLPEGVVAAAESGSRVVLRAQSLDYGGSVIVDDAEVGTWTGAMTPQAFDLTDAVRAGGRTLTIAFATLPDELGQIGWTSRIRAWKARFNYGWDWTPRIVQVGIPGGLEIEATAGLAIERFEVRAGFDPESGVGSIRYRARLAGDGTAVLALDGPDVSESWSAIADGEWHEVAVAGVTPWRVLPDGAQALYSVALDARSPGGDGDRRALHIGFRSVRWLPTADAPEGCEPWLLELNGATMFMAGVNWVPIRPDYADVTREDYLVRLRAYRELGFSVLRIWGGAARESDEFYRLCDEMGFLLWQELPLSSSGLDNLPPSDPEFAAELAAIAEAYVAALAHHPSIILWGGGNELASNAADNTGSLPAVREQSPLAEAGAVFAREDPDRRYVPSSPSGPRALASADDFGTGVHHDVHGPWMHSGTDDEWRHYWDADDAVLRSEVGFDGASRYALLAAHDLVGPTATAAERTKLAARWTHSAAWLLHSFRRWGGTGTLREWVTADQQRQADLLGYAAASARRRFPQCAGFIVWMGHDAYPMPTSLSLLDFDGVLKPAAWAVSRALSGEK